MAAALAGFGVDRKKARELAPEILAEVAACLTDPFLAPLLHPAAAVSEWGLEGRPPRDHPAGPRGSPGL